LLAQAGRLNILERVQFIEAVPHLDVPSYLHRADVLVLPSITTPSWKEQFGRVLVEAMACGIPVIGSDSGAIPEVIGGAGLVFKEGGSTDLANKISDLFSDTSLPEQYRSLGLKRVKEIYSDQAIGNQLREFLNSISAMNRL
jgi:glycosyltransferase involved in cell wall biosynthesis